MANRLIHEQSPYLLQHAHNPVDWHPWSDEAFALAKAAGKPVIVSIGYAACHWCHVMERESFEDEATAAYMNEHFICIKVDREEHPDVDHLYMDAVQAISGSGGWPLNVFVTPERLPFYGGTYYPPKPAYSRPSWLQLLARMNEVWNDQQEEVVAQSEQMLQHLKQASVMASTAGPVWDKATCDKAAENLLAIGDKEWGGFGAAPKFPGSMAISFLLERYHFYKDEAALAQAVLSLDAMIAGGIYDQLNGGFARYSTDREWLAPHFEKMLYDNALLVITLCDAYQITKKPGYRRVIEEIIAFAETELKDKSGLYYSALDADSEGEEGKFYTWTWNEWNALFPEGHAVGESYFGIRKQGNWEGTNILHIAKSIKAIEAETGLTKDTIEAQLSATKTRLRQDQKQRIRPHTDDKSLLSWNALMNIALSRTGTALDDNRYLSWAQQHLQIMIEAFSEKDQLLHVWKKGKARIPAKLDDYAYLIQALLELAAATGNNNLIVEAATWTEYVTAHFSDEKNNYFYFTAANQQDIPVRKTDVHDGATPSANAVMAKNLLLLGMLMERSEWTERGEQMLHTISSSALRYPYSFGYWNVLLQRLLKGNKTGVISGTAGSKALKEFQKSYAPDVYPVLADSYDEAGIPILKDKKPEEAISIFICTSQECLAPQVSVAAALAML